MLMVIVPTTWQFCTPCFQMPKIQQTQEHRQYLVLFVLGLPKVILMSCWLYVLYALRLRRLTMTLSRARQLGRANWQEEVS